MDLIIKLLQGVRLDADLTMESDDGIITCQTLPDQSLVLNFSSEKAFRSFLRNLQQARFSLTDLMKLPDQVASLPYPVRLVVKEVTYLDHQPGQPLKTNQWKLATQLFQKLIGR